MRATELGRPNGTTAYARRGRSVAHEREPRPIRRLALAHESTIDRAQRETLATDHERAPVVAYIVDHALLDGAQVDDVHGHADMRKRARRLHASRAGIQGRRARHSHSTTATTVSANRTPPRSIDTMRLYVLSLSGT